MTQSSLTVISDPKAKPKNNDEVSLEVEAITNFQKLHIKNEMRSLSKFTQSKLL